MGSASMPAEASRKRKSIVTNTMMNGAAQFASLLSTLIFFPLLVRAFGAPGFGVFVIATSVTGLALMFDLGVGVSTVRLVAKRLSLGDAEGFAVVVSTSFALLLVLGAAVALVIAGIGLVGGLVFNVTPEQAALLRTLLLVGAATQLVYWPASAAGKVLAGLERYDLVARTSLLSTVANVAAIGAVLYLGAGPVALMVLAGATTVVAAALNVVILLRVRPAASLAVAPSLPVAREILSGGLPVFVASVAQFLNREQADRLVVGVVLGPAAVAVYEIGAKLSMLVAQLTALTTSAVLPVASGIAARDEDEAMRGLFLKGARYVSLMLAPVIVVLLVLAGQFVRVWFGPGYETAVAVARLLILAQLFVPLYQIGDPVLIGKGRFSVWVRRGLFLAALNVALSVVFVRSFGVAGVAFGTLLACALELPLYAQVVLRETGLTVRRWLSSAAGAYLLLPLGAALAGVAALTPLASSLPGIAIAGALSVGVYWLAAYLFVLDGVERRLVLSRLHVAPNGARSDAA